MSLPPDPSRIRRILIRVNNWIGDVVMISPAVRAIRRRFPRAEITLLARTWVVEALRGNPAYDRLMEYQHRTRHAGFRGRVRLIREIRSSGFDLAVLFQKAFEAALLARAAGIPVRVGFATDRRGWLLSDPLEEPETGHHVDRFLGIASALGCDVADRRLHFHVEPAARDAALRLLERSRVLYAFPRIAIHPGASKPPRGWHPERFTAVATRLARDFEARLLLLGAAGDRPILESMARAIGPAAVLPPPGQRLQEMAAVLERCQLLLCNDSGPMHVAVALRVPVVAVFGPGHPERTGPRSDPASFRAISRDYPCSPCRQDFFRECVPAVSGKPFCLEDVPAEEVIAACGELLNAPDGGARIETYSGAAGR